MEVQYLAQALMNGVMLGLIYSLTASGFTLVFGVTRILNFAHGSIYMISLYVLYYLIEVANINYFLTIILAMVGVGIGGVLVERIFFRPYRGYIYQPFNIALGLSLLISGLALVAFGPIERSIRGIMPGTSKLFGVVASNERLLAMGIASVILFLLWFFVQRVKAGRALRAVAQDMEAASLQGISIDRTCSLSFGIGCALAAGAAAIVGPIFIIDPFIGSGVIMKAMVIVVLGGMGSIPGAILAAFLIGFVESFGYQLIGNIVDMGGFLIVILVLLFKPFGLLGHEEA